MTRVAALAIAAALSVAATAAQAAPGDAENRLRSGPILELLLKEAKPHHFVWGEGSQIVEEHVLLTSPVRMASHPGVCEYDSLDIAVRRSRPDGPADDIRKIETERRFALYAFLPRTDPTPHEAWERRCKALDSSPGEQFARFGSGDSEAYWLAGQVMQQLAKEARGPDAGPLAKACSDPRERCPRGGELTRLLTPQALVSAYFLEDAPASDRTVRLRFSVREPEAEHWWIATAEMRRDDQGTRPPQLVSVRFEKRATLWMH
ncbi:hypothetical protein ACO2Q0_18115 [Phenylobacterium sp. VNQ135]|uniref:hypothetical protein n=1 Tax=Phenylobacterium sp. VNQ135 TaxID=3400922 RepID=UPI003C0542C9